MYGLRTAVHLFHGVRDSLHRQVSTVETAQYFTNWKQYSDPSRETPKIEIKLKLLTGTYIFENNRARYISESNSICKLCDEEVEDIEHFLLSCPILNSTRLRYYSRLDHLTELLYNEPFSTLSNIKKLHYILSALKF
jgi:hypothetical protein